MSQQINLFNPIFLTKKKYFSAVTMLQALGLILLGALLMAVYVNVQLSRLRPEADAVTAQLNAARAQLASVNASQAARQKDGVLEDQVRQTETEVFALQQASRALLQDDGGNTSGYAEYMRAFGRQIVEGLWLTGFSIGAAGKEIAISGGTLRPELVPIYLGRLSNEPTMRNKSFETLEMTPPDAEGRVQPGPSHYLEFRLRSSTGLAGSASSGGAAQ